MLPFAYDRPSSPSSQLKQNEQLLSRLFLLALENERLSQANAQLQENQDQSFSFQVSEKPNHEKVKVQLELKTIEVDNLKIALQELQEKYAVSECKLKQKDQALNFYQKSSKRQMSQLKTQLQSYKNKYQEQLSHRAEFHEREEQFAKLKAQFEYKQKEKTHLIEQLNNDLIYAAGLKQKALQQLQKSTKDLKRQNTSLLQSLSRSQQECLSLKDSLNDAPKLQELNRWIAKVKQYEEKQLQACSRISQMGQDLCTSKQKYRKLEHQHKELQKIKQELEQAVTTNKDGEDSMTIYFERLTTYENQIKELQNQVRRLQDKNRNEEEAVNRKMKKMQDQRDQAVSQWHILAEQMQKQRKLLHAMQTELDSYTSLPTLQSKQFQPVIQHPLQSIVQSRLTQKIQLRKRQLNVDFKLNPKTHKRDSSIIHQHGHDLVSNRSQQKIVFHSDRVSHSSDRLVSQGSQILGLKQSGCYDCDSRVKMLRCSSTDRTNLNSSFSHNNIQTHDNLALRQRNPYISDQKRMLMDKLNYLRPVQDTHLRINERPISSLYQNKNRMNLASQGSQGIRSSTRLTINKGEGKENMNQMVMRRYTNLMRNK